MKHLSMVPKAIHQEAFSLHLQLAFRKGKRNYHQVCLNKQIKPVYIQVNNVTYLNEILRLFFQLVFP